MNFSTGLGVSLEPSQFAARQIDIYVDGALGHDSNAGTFGSPLKTFQAAINSADDLYNPGNNNIFLKPGVYGGGVINDDDMLKVFGLGANPWDVSVMGDSAEGDTVHISGGADVRLYNLHVSGSSSNGIFADDLGYLFMDRVISNYNNQSGFYGEDVSRVKIHNSSLKFNDDFGAVLHTGQQFRAVNSHFDNNSGGAAVSNVDSVQMIGSTARNNQNVEEDRGEASFAVVPSSGNGLTVDSADSVLVNGGEYNDNDGSGIGLDDVGTLSLLGVRAANNGDWGARANFHNSAVISGGRYEDNGEDGLLLERSFIEPTVNGLEPEQAYATVYGGQFFNNADDGLDIQNVYSARVYGIDARGNEDDGLDGDDVYSMQVVGGYLFSNDDHGFSLENVYMTQVNDLVSNANNGSGMSARGGYRLNIIGGVFSHNEEWGISAEGYQGEAEYQRVDIKFATVTGNYDGGVNVANSYLAKMVGGTYSNNEDDGIVMTNVKHGMFTDILVRDNEDHGLRFNSGGGFGNGVPPVLALAPEGPNWNRLEFLGGAYINNGYDGIYVSTNENRGYAPGNIHIKADFVVARGNGYTGFNVGGSLYDEIANLDEYGFGANLDLQMTGGYYSYNGNDGIYLLGTASEDPALGLLTAKMTDVVAEFNGRYGVRGSSILGGIPFPQVPGFAVGGPENGSLIHVTRGFYGYNSNDGLNFQVGALIGDIGQPNLVGETEYPLPGNLATFDHVVAFQNGGSGLWFDTFIRGGIIIPDDGGEMASFAPGDEGAYPPVINILGGAYNLNQSNGISLTSSADVFDGPGRLLEDGFVAVGLQDVDASVNGQNGLFIRNNNPEVFRGDVNILRGVFNANQVDGVFVQGMGYLNIYQSLIASNRDDGVHSRDNSSTTTTSAVIVGNHNMNVRIES